MIAKRVSESEIIIQFFPIRLHTKGGLSPLD